MNQARLARPSGVLLLGPVRGLWGDVAPLLAALEAHGTRQLGLALSPEELRSISEYFVGPEFEPVVPLTMTERNEVQGLVRFGEVRVPNPAFVESLRWAAGRAVKVAALDPDEDATAALFAEHIGYLELVRRTVRERRAGRSPPTPSTADDFALEWDRTVAPGSGSRRYVGARNLHLVNAASALAADGTPLAVIVDRERFEDVRALFEGKGRWPGAS